MRAPAALPLASALSPFLFYHFHRAVIPVNFFCLRTHITASFLAVLFLLFVHAGQTLAAESFSTGERTYAVERSVFPAIDNGSDRRPQVRRVRIRGNETFPDMVLMNIIATEAPAFFRRMQFWRPDEFDYSLNEVRRDAIRIERFYRRRGFYDVAVTFDIQEGRRDHQRLVTFFVDEGEPTRVHSLELIFENTDEEKIEEIRQMRDFQRAENNNPLQVSRRYEAVKHPDIESAYLTALRNSGFAFARTRIEADVDTLRRKADVRVIMEPKQIATFRDIFVEGELSVPEDLIRFQSAIRPGDVYSLRKMRDAQQLLFRHPLMRLVTISVPDQEPGEEVDIRIRIREQALRSVKVQAGFGNEELLRGQVTWTHRNPLGNGHRFTISSRASFIEQRGNLEYLIPGFVNPRSNLAITPFALRKDEDNYLIYRYGINNNITYYFSQFLVGSVSYELSRNDERLKDGGRARTDSTQVFNISSLRLSALYNESSGDISRGWAVRPNAEFSGLFGTGSLTYQRFSLDVRRFIDFSSTTQLALRADSGLLLSRDPFDTPANIRFYAGGANSVRGYSRRQLGPKRPVFNSEGEFRQYLPLGGQAVLMFNTELRQGLPGFLRNVQLAGFLDGGQVWLNYNEFDPRDFQYGAGGGIRYMSPIGPIRLDIGWKLNPSDEDLNRFNGQDRGGVNRWALHFSIGQAF
ncbi:outer membrane protein assembly complex, YaeT protein [Cyclonatronum proteinivorum]|uniref:Outer membrane protein assembly complex, YaeT protein n=1 Tax=Cyclonatronum proteinivorum TaxID=1457365 RepID=A0A345UPW4_9BACT|nr:outer membrane protein assembly complex, YaeT protein [Cyclonatronum proteinivorum]